MLRYGVGVPFYPETLLITEKKGYLDQWDSELQKSPAIQTRRVVYSHQLRNGEQIVITDDGFLGLCMPENNNKTE